MARPSSSFPTQQELRILKIFWLRGALTVRDVRESLAEQDRDLAHTTVVTTLHTMTDKGLLDRKHEGRAYRFEALVNQSDVSRGMLGDLLTRVFDGSPRALLLNLLDSEHVTDEEHQQLRKLINKRRRKDES